MLIKAEKLAQGGRAVGRLEDGRVVFIDGLFPSEEAEISIVEDKSSYCIAKVLSIITKSPNRRTSPCPKSSECGGCPWIELDYRAQFEAKNQIVRELFADFPDLKYEEPVSGPEFGYRSRARFQYRIENGKARLGFCAENSNKSIAIPKCPVADKALNDLIENPPRLNAWELKNSELSCITTDDGVLYDDRTGWITINGRRLPVSNKVFFQSNLILLPQLIDYVVSLTEGPGVMDLYSGVGTFSAYLEDRFDVTAVEINKFCLSLAKSHLKNTQFFTSPVEKWNPKTRKVDTVIVDPPRVGLDKKVPDMIASWNPKKIIYVSCYPPTMHRDIQRLTQLGYKADTLKLFDFYPQTAHVETCVLLVREQYKDSKTASIKVDLAGVLADYLPPATREDEINYVNLSLGNLYHELCHRYIHADRDKNTAKFRGTCKSVFYLIQNLHFLESGHFILSRRDLKEAVADEDRIILEMADLPDGYDFDLAFSSLFIWCQNAFARIKDLGGK